MDILAAVRSFPGLLEDLLWMETFTNVALIMSIIEEGVEDLVVGTIMEEGVEDLVVDMVGITN